MEGMEVEAGMEVPGGMMIVIVTAITLGEATTVEEEEAIIEAVGVVIVNVGELAAAGVGDTESIPRPRFLELNPCSLSHTTMQYCRFIYLQFEQHRITQFR